MLQIEAGYRLSNPQLNQKSIKFAESLDNVLTSGEGDPTVEIYRQRLREEQYKYLQKLLYVKPPLF